MAHGHLLKAEDEETLPETQDWRRLDYAIETKAAVTSGTYLPFLLTMGRRGQLSPDGKQAMLQPSLQYRVQHHSGLRFSLGADLSLYASSHYPYYGDQIKINQLYAEGAYHKYRISVGAADAKQQFVDSRLSSGNMVWSENARNLAGLSIRTEDFVSMIILGGAVEAKFEIFYGKMWGDSAYNMSQFQQYLSHVTEHPQYALRATGIYGTHVHRKSVFLRTPSYFPLQLTIGGEHVALYGGQRTHIDGYWDGPLQVTHQQLSASSWFKALVGAAGSGDRRLNHTASLDARLDYTGHKYTMAIYKQHYIDDLGRHSFAQFADGLWGFEMRMKRWDLLQHIVLEFVKSDSQGDNSQIVNNRLNGIYDNPDVPEPSPEDYASDFYQDETYGAYAYSGLAVGNPMLVSPIYNRQNMAGHPYAQYYPGFGYNNIQGFHLGAEGRLTYELDYRLLFSHTSSKGTAWAPLSAGSVSHTSVMLEGRYTFSPHWQASVSAAYDAGKLYGNNIGALFSVRYSANHTRRKIN